ncbi:hypothetical protein D3C59_35150 [Streptomyces sp. SHP22-7]|nr:hypothetical protein D3C59_35150 [Streptomyces sp. SHP22-7]
MIGGGGGRLVDGAGASAALLVPVEALADGLFGFVEGTSWRRARLAGCGSRRIRALTGSRSLVPRSRW